MSDYLLYLLVFPIYLELMPILHLSTQDNLSGICLRQDGAYLLVERGFLLVTQFYLLGNGNV